MMIIIIIIIIINQSSQGEKWVNGEDTRERERSEIIERNWRARRFPRIRLLCLC